MRLCLTLMFLAQAAVAEMPIFDEKVSLSAFGGWAYGNTDNDNSYLNGSPEGEYENARFAVALSSNPIERLRLSGQFELESDPATEDDVEVELDYAFAAWRFNDGLTMRIGRGKHPFGIYTEVFDLGTVRPFFDLPQALYGPAGIAGESYNGVGISGHLPSGRWEVTYDVYAGSLDFEVNEPWELLREEGEEDEDEEEDGEEDGEEEEEGATIESKERDDLLGLRLSVATPVAGLSFGWSAYTGRAEAEEANLEDDDAEGEKRHSAYGFHLEYLRGDWSIRSEYGFLDEEENLEVEAFYLEAAYFLTEKWQLAARYDWSDTEVEEVDLAPQPSLGEHRDLALGINYWFAHNFVLKLAVHEVDGNRFAVPREAEAGFEESLEEETRLIQFGAQFSF